VPGAALWRGGKVDEASEGVRRGGGQRRSGSGCYLEKENRGKKRQREAVSHPPSGALRALNSPSEGEEIHGEMH
jgi:hypothetical protein